MVIVNKTLLVITPSSGHNEPYYIFVAETGECLASHFCSHEGFAKGDLYYELPKMFPNNKFS
jgi:hypothetical protein